MKTWRKVLKFHVKKKGGVFYLTYMDGRVGD